MHGNKFGVAFGRTAGGAVKINSDAIRTHFHIQIYERVRVASRPPPMPAGQWPPEILTFNLNFTLSLLRKNGE